MIFFKWFWILYKRLYTFPMYQYIGKVYKPLYKIQKLFFKNQVAFFILIQLFCFWIFLYHFLFSTQKRSCSSKNIYGLKCFDQVICAKSLPQKNYPYSADPATHLRSANDIRMISTFRQIGVNLDEVESVIGVPGRATGQP